MSGCRSSSQSQSPSVLGKTQSDSARAAPLPSTLAPTPATQNNGNNPNQILHFRKILLESMEAFESQIPDVPVVDSDDAVTAEKRMRAYVLLLQESIAVGNDAPRGNILDRCLGMQRWYIGKALLQLKPLDKAARGLIKHGDWEPFLESVGLDDVIAWRCRAVAKYFPRREDAALFNWQWTAMVEALPPRQKEGKSGKDTGAQGSDEKDRVNQDDAEPVDTRSLIEPLGNHIQRLSKFAGEFLKATELALDAIQSGNAVGLSLSVSKEVAGFKSLVPNAEAAANSLYDGIANLYRLAEQTASTELTDIRTDLDAFLKRHESWRGSTRGGNQ